VKTNHKESSLLEVFRAPTCARTVFERAIKRVALFGLLSFISLAAIAQQTLQPVDTALVIAVDVSNSVDERRYRLQMNGIAKALEDPSVIGTILNGAQGAILVSIVAWSDRPQIALEWMRISSREEAFAVAALVRALPRITGEFTCLANMLRYLNDKVLPTVPAPALRKVVDVSGDGKDNCNSRIATPEIRDELVGYRTIINGLPILEGSEALTLENWYRDNVQGGPGSFILAAESFEDFGRAIRQKFIVEISGIDPRDGLRSLASVQPTNPGMPDRGSLRVRN